MPDPDPAAWTEHTSGRERVRMVVETLDEPATVSEIADGADVAWGTANSELERLVAENRVRERDIGGNTAYEPNPVQQLVEQILELIAGNDRAELESQLADYQSQVETLQDEYGAATVETLRERLTDDDVSADEVREIRTAAETWDALDLEIRLRKHALQLYDDVSRVADSDGDLSLSPA